MKYLKSRQLRTLSSAIFICSWFFHCNGTEDAFLCSEASAHINSCCGRIVHIKCDEESTQGGPIHPQEGQWSCNDHHYIIVQAAFSPETSKCIIDKNCDDIVTSGICDLGPFLSRSQCSGSINVACQAFTKLSCPQ
jgi:hypothetical protein